MALLDVTGAPKTFGALGNRLVCLCPVPATLIVRLQKISNHQNKQHEGFTAVHLTNLDPNNKQTEDYMGF